MAACNGAILTMLMRIFPSRVASITAGTETFMGLGYMAGPVIGSYLYLFGGFPLPFFITGMITVAIAFGLLFLLPKLGKDSDEEKQPIQPKENESPLTVCAVSGSLALMFPYVDNFVAYTGNGFIVSMLEPHMKRTANASQFEVAYAFLLLGILYMSCNVLAGAICDRTNYPDFVSFLGNALQSVAFLLVGPSPILPFLKPDVTLMQASTSLSGAGIALVVVSTFTRALRAAFEQGYGDSMDTYLVVSGLWTASFHLGQLVGSTVSGFLVEAWGFRNTSIVFYIVYQQMTIVNLVGGIRRLIANRKRSQYENFSAETKKFEEALKQEEAEEEKQTENKT